MRKLWLHTALAVAVPILLTGCANLNTVGRSTSVTKSSGLKAIHLDAQQRVVLATADKFCAEPSPDALAAYAASLGIGASVPGTGAASLAAAQQSSAASIGLRTQSIQLMRDALYRMCEAMNSGHMQKIEVAAFLRRSQDLTAVVLAIEQLTGAVTANQVILSGNSAADASANLVANQQILDQAKDREAALKTASEEAAAELVKAEEKLTASKEKETEAQSDFTAACEADPVCKADANLDEPNTWQPATKDKKDILDAAAKQKASDQSDLASAKETNERKQEQYADAKKIREQVAATLDSAATNANASTQTAGKFSVVIPRKELSNEATKEIADSVTSMVQGVLKKEYYADMCMSFLVSTTEETKEQSERASLSDDAKDARSRVFGICENILTLTAEQQIANYVEITPDDISAKLQALLDTKKITFQDIHNFKRENDIVASVYSFLRAGEFADAREKYYDSLPAKLKS